MAAQRGTAILQRGRSHGGQVIVITQSAADIEALSGQPGLLASLTDNFTGVVLHRQTSPESRDWLAKLMGTRAIWQTTNQTSGHGSQHTTVVAKLARHGIDSVDARGALCYPNMHRGLLHSNRARDGLIIVDDPRHIAKLTNRRGDMTPSEIQRLADRIATGLPPAA